MRAPSLSPEYRRDLASGRWRRLKGQARARWRAEHGQVHCWARWCRRRDVQWHHLRYADGARPVTDVTVDDLVPLCSRHHNQVTQAWRRERRRWFGPRRSLAATTRKVVRPAFPRWARRGVLTGLVAWYVAAVYHVDVLAVAVRSVELVVGWVVGAPLLWGAIGVWWLLRRRR